MKKKSLRLISFVLVMVLLCTQFTVLGEELNINGKSAISIEKETGDVLFEKDPDVQLPIASVTKVMTMLLIAEGLDSGKFTLEDMVTTSEYAASMRGSRVFLEQGEQLSVSDMLKSIAIASGNDAAVAMAEFIGGTEEGFVQMMNDKAAELGMKNTHFVNCNGLDVDGHYSSARDVAIMSRALLSHESVRPFLNIYMDSLRDGKFTLANTNKLTRFYEGCTGVKTGSTDQALYCLSASALRDGMELISVVLGAPSSQKRFGDGSNMLNYGFNNYGVTKLVTAGEEIAQLPVKNGVTDMAAVVAETDYAKMMAKANKTQIDKTVDIPAELRAPLKAGEVIGKITLTSNGETVGEVNVVVKEDIKGASYFKLFGDLFRRWVSK